MPATPLVPTSRFIEPGVAQFYWVATIANKSAPTRTELDAGTDLTGELATVTGFTVTSATVDAPDFASRFVAKVPGKITADDSKLTFYRSDDSNDVRTLLTRDLKGFVVIFPEGDVSTNKMDVFPVTVTAASKIHSDTDPAHIEIDFSITSEPATDVAVPV